jgi:hypothetical protein
MRTAAIAALCALAFAAGWALPRQSPSRESDDVVVLAPPGVPVQARRPDVHADIEKTLASIEATHKQTLADIKAWGEQMRAELHKASDDYCEIISKRPCPCRQGVSPPRELTWKELTAGCKCADGKSLCVCGPACECDSDYWDRRVPIRHAP